MQITLEQIDQTAPLEGFSALRVRAHNAHGSAPHSSGESGGAQVWTLELHHGKANEVGSAELDELERLAARLAAPDGPVALITFSRRRSARGTPIFISGANVTEREGWSDEQVRAHVRRQRRILSELRHAPVFHVCVVSGVALGWGTELLITADYKLCTPEATFGLPETGLGILPGAGGTSELWALIGPAQALRLGMTGERIGAEEAVRIGLAQELHADLDAALARASALCARAALCSPTALAAFKGALLSCIGGEGAARMEREAVAYERCVSSGQAAIGRGSFAQIRDGVAPAWGPRR